MSRVPGYLKSPTLLLIVVVVAYILGERLAGLMTLDALMLFMYFLGIAAALNIIMGFAGYVSFGHAVFLGIGAYTYILLVYFVPTMNSLQKMGAGLGVFAVAVVAGLAAAAVAATIGAVVLRLRGAFFAIATIGLDFAALYIVKGVVPTLNPEQFYGAQVILPSWAIVPKEDVFNAMLLTFLLVILTNYAVRRSGFGMGLLAIKEDEDAAEVLGVPTAKYKTIAFTLSAFFTGMLGAIFALNGGGVDEGIFHLGHSINMIVMIVIGGLGTVSGPIVGGIIYYWLYDLLLIHYPGLNLVILGIIVGLVVLFAPEGIIGILRKLTFQGVRLRELLE